MRREHEALLAAVRAWRPEEAWRLLDLLEALHALVWALHEDDLVELSMRVLDEAHEPADDDTDAEPLPF